MKNLIGVLIAVLIAVFAIISAVSIGLGLTGLAEMFDSTLLQFLVVVPIIVGCNTLIVFGATTLANKIH
jgi:hypothetical protein